MAAFDRWAAYYDLIHHGLPGDVAFYVQRALRAKAGVLEIGVGTGRIALPMVAAGINVTGLDNSKPMLALCRAKKRAIGRTPGRLALVLADMRRFQLSRRFSFIAMPYRTFMHLLTPRDQRRCLASVRAHLADEGTFILNSWAPTPRLARTFSSPVAGKLKLAGTHRLPESDARILHYHATSCDKTRQLLVEKHVLREVDPKGHVIHEAVLPLIRAWTTRRQMDDLLRRCGLVVDALYGDFNGRPFTADGAEMIYVLRAEMTRL